MAWVTHTRETFLNELLALPRQEQHRVVSQVFRRLEAEGPFQSDVRKLRDRDDIWRCRVGHLRILFRVEGNVIDLLSIRRRDHAYDHDLVVSEPTPAVELDERGLGQLRQPVHLPLEEEPELAPSLAKQEGEKRPIPPSMPATAEPRGGEEPAATPAEEEDERGLTPSTEPLPRPITEELLGRLLIPHEHRPALLACRTGDDLLAADVPSFFLTRVVDALYPSSVEQTLARRAYLVPSAEALGKFVEGDLPGFLLALDPEQERLVRRALRGPTMVKGRPGTGKSTVALHRVRALAEPEPAEAGRLIGGWLQVGSGEPPRILFTTYTNALVQYSRQLLDHLLAGLAGSAQIEVTTLDKLAHALVRRHHRDLRLIDDREVMDELKQIQARFRGSGDLLSAAVQEQTIRSLRPDYLAAEIHWVIEGRGLTTVEQYLATSRAGRGYALQASQRRAVWEVYTALDRRLRAAGRWTWGRLRQRALALARERPAEERFHYVLVDEAQDLTPVALAFAVELARSPEGVFLTADQNQSLYNRGFRWADAHTALNLRGGRVARLKRNYRTTRQIVEAALDIMAGDESETDGDTLLLESVLEGPRPYCVGFGNPGERARWLAEQLKQAARELRLPFAAIGVLVPTRPAGEELAHQLSRHGLAAEFVSGRDLDLGRPKAKVLTLHSAKGLEFPIVAIPHLDAGLLPRPLPDHRAADCEEHLAEQRRLFFVGCTRAMRRLFVTYLRNNPSPFVSQLTPAHWYLGEA